MTTSTIHGPHGVLRIEREVVEITSNAPRRDPDWRFVDSHGHEHRWDGSDTPTLRWVVDDTYWCADCHEEHSEGHYECRECGETVEPGMRPAPMHREFLPGLTSYYLNDEPVTGAEAERLLASLKVS